MVFTVLCSKAKEKTKPLTLNFELIHVIVFSGTALNASALNQVPLKKTVVRLVRPFLLQ